MRKTIPATLFTGKEAAPSPAKVGARERGDRDRMNEQQFWNFVSAQPIAENRGPPIGRLLHVTDMPEEVQKRLGLFDRRSAGTI